MLIIKLMSNIVKNHFSMAGNDPRTNHLPLVSSYYQVILILLSYVIFTTKLGPSLMANRKPFQLTLILRVYNVLQIIINLFVFLGFAVSYGTHPKYNWLCMPVDKSDFSPETLKILEVSYLCYMTKIIDLLDTVFFVLRKKQNQISFLHVYHHATMVWAGFLYHNEFFDKRLIEYPLLGSPWGAITTVGIYLLVVLKLGPRFMANRKPYKVDGLIKVFNVIQILLNLAIFYESLKYSYWRDDYSRTCERYDPNDNRVLTMKLVRPALLYHYSKYLDLFDTIFFLARKKFNQISFLHVYHHCMMVFGVYVYCSFLFASHFTFTGVINSFIHVLMYSYYLIAAMKPRWNLQPLKRNLTRAQLIQFAILLVHFTFPFVNNWCNLPLFWLIVSLIQNYTMIALFGNFYYKAYIAGGRREKKPMQTEVGE